MGIWFAGLPRRSSAERAAKWGGIACLFQSVRETLGNLLSVSVAHKPLDHAIAWFVGQSLLPIFVAVAGMRLWRRGGWIWGSLAAVLLVADLAFAALNLAPAIDDYRRILATMPSLTSTMEAALLTGFAVKVAVVLLILNGVRGAVALTRVDYSEDLHRAFS